MSTLGRVIKEIELELSGELYKYAVVAKQGDKGTRYIQITLTNAGDKYIIPDGVLVSINIVKPDGEYCYDYCIVENGNILVELTNQILAKDGTALCDIEIRTNDDNEVLSSASFELIIEETQRDENAIESSSEFTALEKRIHDDLNQIDTKEQEITIAEESRVTEEQLRVTAESSRAIAEQSRVTAESSRVTAEQSRVTAESSRVTAESSRATAESSRATAEQSRATAESSRVTAEQSRTTTFNNSIQAANAATDRANTAAIACEDIVSGTAIENKLDKTGDGSNVTVAFTMATEESDIQTGTKMSVILGKISKSISTFRSAIGTLSSLGTTVKTSLVAAINEINSGMINKIYPVGAIYMSVNNVSPATFIGGTWTALQDRFLIGAGSTYTVNSIGGETTHVLTTAEIPRHQHSNNIYGGVGGFSNGASGLWHYGGSAVATTYGSSDMSSSVGDGAAHNNLPPYLAVYMWKRTA